MKIYVGNLTNTTSETDVMNLFSTVRSLVSVTIIKDRATGMSKGFGFIEYDNQSSGKEAIASFNGTELNGAKLKVSEAKQRF